MTVIMRQIALLLTVLLSLVVAQQTDQDATAMQMLQLVNAVRLQNNIRPLCFSEKLVRAATVHSTYQASIGTMTHDGPVSLGDRFLRQGYQPAAVAENVGFTSTPFLQVVFDIWMSSPEHRTNILDPTYTHFGSANTQGTNGMYFWTQLFASPMSVALEPCDFGAAATAASLSPDQTNFAPNGAYGMGRMDRVNGRSGYSAMNGMDGVDGVNGYSAMNGMDERNEYSAMNGMDGYSNYNNYNPSATPNASCLAVDAGLNGKSLVCKLNRRDGLANANSRGAFGSGMAGNGNAPPFMNTNLNSPLNQNPLLDPTGPNVIQNPGGYSDTACRVVSTSPSPDGHGSIRVLSCQPNAMSSRPSNYNALGLKDGEFANPAAGPVYHENNQTPVGYGLPGVDPPYAVNSLGFRHHARTGSSQIPNGPGDNYPYASARGNSASVGMYNPAGSASAPIIINPDGQGDMNGSPVGGAGYRMMDAGMARRPTFQSVASGSSSFWDPPSAA